jgi:iron complex transport system substrate-binding protein
MVLKGSFTRRDFAKLTGGAALALASPAANIAAQSGEITVTTPMGDVTLPGPAQRVVPIEWNLVEHVLLLGVQPVAIADVEGFNTWVNPPVPLEEGVGDVGLRYEPSLESLGAAEPDLILGMTDRDEVILDQLNAIAPTILLDTVPKTEGETPIADIDDTLRTVAVALGREAEAEEVIAATTEHLAAAATTLADAGLAGAPFVVAQAFTSETVPTMRLFNDRSLFAYTLTSLGLTNGWIGEGDIESDPWGFQTVAVEALAKVPEDSHFFYVVQDDDNIFEEALATDPIWTSLPFVQDGQTYALGGDTWTFGAHHSVTLLVDKVVAALTGDA